MNTKPIFWIASLVMAASLAPAQRNGISRDVRGSGTLTRERDQHRLYSASIDLRDNGSATVTLIGEKRWAYQGTWRDYGRDDYEVEIRNAYGDSRARGTIQISINRGEIDAITVRDGYADNTRFSANFNVRDSGGMIPDRPGDGAVVGSGTTRGDGKYYSPDSRDRDFGSASHSFNSNGTFTIRPAGGETFSGRYTRSGNSVRLTILEVGRNRASSGSGTATVKGRTLERASLSARTSRGTYGLSWRADSDASFGRPFRFDQRGTGTATSLASRNLEVDRASGDFRGDGKFTIWLYDGSRRISVEGRWNDGYFFGGNNGFSGDDRFQNGNRIVLDIEKYDGRAATGTGTYDRANNNSVLAKLTIVGTVGRQRVVAGFNPRR